MHFHPYTLYSRGALNAVSHRHEFHGALILMNEGVGCLHPWPEFGDATVVEQLDVLRSGGTSKVIERALHMATVDGEARRKGVSLFAGLEVPPSHYSWDKNQPIAPQIHRIKEEGWGALKGKGSRDVADVWHWLDHLDEWLGDADVKVRVDFNSCLEAGDFEGLMHGFSKKALARLDFIEDPFAYDPEEWMDMQERHGVRLALDKAVRGARHGFDVAVLKPARREWRDIVAGILPQEVKLMMTSAMDHAIGQSFAAYEAALAWKEMGDRITLCGLCTEHLFANDVFFERISSRGGRLAVDRSGTGLGFDEPLRKLAWLRL